jgi:phosphohistidine phosphatase
MTSAAPSGIVAPMRLLLIRHGKAGDPDAWAKKGKDDALRPLTSAGKKEMKSAARGLRKIIDRLDALATSPFKRALRTAEIVYAAYDDKPQFLEAPVLQGAPAARLVAWLREHDLDADSSTVAVVGHEPHLAHWAGWFLSGKEKPLVKFKKGSVCILDFPKSIGPAKATLYALYHPADLRRFR